MIIQILLIVAVLIIALYVLGRRNTHSGKAWQKISLFLLFVLMVVSILFPDLLNKFAHLTGVGRGADLVLYGLALVLVFFILNSYLSRQDQRDKTYRLARKLALSEALQRYKLRD
jgi:hypothetical protein